MRGADRLIDVASARLFYERLPPQLATLRVYEGFYHELFNEPAADRARPSDFLGQASPPAAGGLASIRSAARRSISNVGWRRRQSRLFSATAGSQACVASGLLPASSSLRAIMWSSGALTDSTQCRTPSA